MIPNDAPVSRARFHDLLNRFNNALKVIKNLSADVKSLKNEVAMLKTSSLPTSLSTDSGNFGLKGYEDPVEQDNNHDGFGPKGY